MSSAKDVVDSARTRGISTSAAPDGEQASSFGRVVVLCSLIGFLDGFDTQSVGPAASAIAAELGLRIGALGPVFSASQAGFLAGALSFGPLGDRFGRKRALLVAIALFALCTLGTTLVHSYEALLACRVLVGLGLGGATPNFVSLASEFSPPKLRNRVVTMMWAAVPLGGMTASFAGAAILSTLGWKALFVIGCVAPLLLLPILYIFLPESHEIAQAPGATSREPEARTVAALFTQQRAGTTVVLWLISFMTWMTLIGVAFWTPSLLQQVGLSASAAATVLAMNNAGGVIGTILIGACLGKWAVHRVLLLAYLAAAAFIALMGTPGIAFPLLLTAGALAGFFSSAVGGGIIAVSANLYPANVRASAVGWALGVGRLGSIVGPLGTGLLVTRSWSVADIYLITALPALLCAGLMLQLARPAGAEGHA
jgi:AAHS family 4-hydroxybenzoate transporter-like MFS transporter